MSLAVVLCRRAGKRHLEVRDDDYEEEEGDDDGSGVDEDEAIDDIAVPVFQPVSHADPTAKP